MIGHILFFFRRAFSNIAGEPVATLLTLMVVFISFLILGAYAAAGMNVATFINHFAGQAQIVVDLADTVDRTRIDSLLNDIRREPEVREAEFISKQAAMDRLRKDLADSPDFLDGIEEIPIPASVEIKIRSTYRERTTPSRLVEKLKTMEGVAAVDAGDEFTDAFSRVLAGMWAAGGVIAVFLMFSAVFIVANTIRLTIIRRKDEIDNMRLVGATNAFVKAPFLIEGTLVGSLGAALAVVALDAVFVFFIVPAAVRGPFLSVLTEFDPRFLSPVMILTGIGLGALVGFIGAQLSVGRYLKV